MNVTQIIIINISNHYNACKPRTGTQQHPTTTHTAHVTSAYPLTRTRRPSLNLSPVYSNIRLPASARTRARNTVGAWNLRAPAICSGNASKNSPSRTKFCTARRNCSFPTTRPVNYSSS